MSAFRSPLTTQCALKIMTVVRSTLEVSNLTAVMIAVLFGDSMWIIVVDFRVILANQCVNILKNQCLSIFLHCTTRKHAHRLM